MSVVQPKHVKNSNKCYVSSSNFYLYKIPIFEKKNTGAKWLTVCYYYSSTWHLNYGSNSTSVDRSIPWRRRGSEYLRSQSALQFTSSFCDLNLTRLSSPRKKMKCFVSVLFSKIFKTSFVNTECLVS